MVTVAKALAYQCDAFAVAFIDEAMELRQQGITQPILLLEGVFSRDDVVNAANLNCWLMATSMQSVNDIVETPTDSTIDVWLKVDTGMHRLGIMPEQFNQAYQCLKQCEHIDNIIVTSHLSHANNLVENNKQLNILMSLTNINEYKVSVANSAAILHNIGTEYNWCRPGIMLYGASPIVLNNDLKPAMVLTSSIIAIRDISRGESVGYEATWTATRPSKIATVAIGYGDGYPRSATNGTPVWVDDATVPIVGAVSMDLITVDISNHPNVNNLGIGDTVELWGNNLNVNVVAKHANTIGYECLAQLSPRVPRVYIKD